MSLLIDRLSVDLDGTRILHDMTLEVADGETVAVLGPSGSGKSTLLRAVAGLVPPAAGTVSVDGRDLAGVPVHERGFGVVFQAYALFEHLDVAGNVAFGLRMRGLDRSEVQRRVADALDRVGLGGLGDRAVDTLSGGERQRVALARALVVDPVVLLADEPLGAVDVALKDRLLGDVGAVVADHTTLYVTHDHDEAMTIGDRVALLREGRLVAVGVPSELWSRPPDPWSARFLGHRNVYEDGGPFGEHPLLVPEASVVAGDGGLPGTVTASTFAGDAWRITARIDDDDVTFRSHEPIETGTTVHLSANQVVAFDVSSAEVPKY